MNLLRTLSSGAIKGHFGQWAEDVLVRKLFPKEKNSGFYLDLGAYHPFTHSNTAYFWLKGWCGVNVDANPNSIKLFQKHRPSDQNIWTAIVPESDVKAGNTRARLMLPTAKDAASGISATGTVHKETSLVRSMTETVDVPATSVSRLLRDNNIRQIDYLNIDIEGHDEMIIDDFPFSSCRPSVISIEDYPESLADVLKSKISENLFANDYILVGRAGPTSIYVSKLNN